MGGVTSSHSPSWLGGFRVLETRWSYAVDFRWGFIHQPSPAGGWGFAFGYSRSPYPGVKMRLVMAGCHFLAARDPPLKFYRVSI